MRDTTNPTASRDIERLEYWQGQLLRSSDFEMQENADDQRRWWHNRSLHNAYGVSIGLEVTTVGDGLSVSRGLAYDGQGQELLVAGDTRIRFPKPIVRKPGGKPEATVLILRKAGPRATRGDIFSCVPCSPGAGTAEFGWVRLSRFDGCSSVPIALVQWDPKTMVASLDTTVDQPRSRPIARPHTGNGITPAGGTVWETWSEPLPGVTSAPHIFGLQTTVDTSAAGFAEVPVYIARLQEAGKLPFPPICRIYSPQPDSFIFRVWLLQIPTNLSVDLPVAKVVDMNKEATMITLDPLGGFAVDDVIQRTGKKDVYTVRNLNDDGSIEIEPAMDGLKKGEVIHLAFLDSLDRVRTLLQTQTIYPKMQIQIEGVDFPSGESVTLSRGVEVSPTGGIRFVPEGDIEKLAIGDGPGDVPRFSYLNPLPADYALITQDLGWHVSWLGAVSECGPSLKYGDAACEISAKEVC